MKGCSQNSILVIIGDLIVVVNIFTLRKGIEEKKGTPDFRLEVSKTLGRKDLSPDTSGLALCACGRASELGLLQRSGLTRRPPSPSHYHWEQLLTLWWRGKGVPVVDGVWGESQGIEVPDAHLQICCLHLGFPPGAGWR